MSFLLIADATAYLHTSFCCTHAFPALMATLAGSQILQQMLMLCIRQQGHTVHMYTQTDTEIIVCCLLQREEQQDKVASPRKVANHSATVTLGNVVHMYTQTGTRTTVCCLLQRGEQQCYHAAAMLSCTLRKTAVLSCTLRQTLKHLFSAFCSGRRSRTKQHCHIPKI